MTAQFNDALTRIVSLCVDEYENMTHGVSYFLYPIMIHVQLFTTRLTPYLRTVDKHSQQCVVCIVRICRATRGPRSTTSRAPDEYMTCCVYYELTEQHNLIATSPRRLHTRVWICSAWACFLYAVFRLARILRWFVRRKNKAECLQIEDVCM